MVEAVQVCDAHLVNATGRIVVGVDHSEGSLKALEFAVDEASLRGVELEVVWAWSDRLPGSDVTGGMIDGVDVEARAQMQLDALVASRIPEGLDVRARAVVQQPESALVESSRFAELLVVGARGQGGFLGLRLGSVSLKVASSSLCPVVVVHPTIEGPEFDTEPRIVVGVDGSQSAMNALRWALAEGAIRELPVIAVNGWMEPVIGVNYPGLLPPMDALESAAKALLDTEIEMAAPSAPGVTVYAQPVCASPASAVIDASRGASLVVVGSKGRGDFIGLLLGSVTQQVLRHADCPVVVVPSSETTNH